MSYKKYTQYYKAKQSQWIKHCTNRVRRQDERDILERERDNYELRWPIPNSNEQTILKARAKHRKQLQWERQRVRAVRYSATRYMTQTWVDELKDVLQKDKWRFYYGKDDYAQILLSYALERACFIQTLKMTPYAKLLYKPSIKSIVADCGNGELHPEQLFVDVWKQRECYLLTLDEWGQTGVRDTSWQQTSRPGKNLVLQLNFSNKHNQSYYTNLNPISFEPFSGSGHPIAAKPLITMAWVRIDVADDLSHALIEEIQTDWLRDATHRNTWYYSYAREGGQRRRIKKHCNEVGVSERAWQSYEKVLAPHKKMWAEAALSVAIVLLKEEMGIRKIYYHSFESGNVFKGFSDSWLPPRSLYTTLPERFCFQKTEEPPPILEEQIAALRKVSQVSYSPLSFYLLDLP